MGAMRLPSPGPVAAGLFLIAVAVILARRASQRGEPQQRKTFGLYGKVF